MNFRRQPILCTTLYRNPMQASNFGGTFDQLFLRIFYKIFTKDASLPLLYHGAKKSKMTKNSNQGGPALKERKLHLKRKENITSKGEEAQSCTELQRPFFLPWTCRRTSRNPPRDCQPRCGAPDKPWQWPWPPWLALLAQCSSEAVCILCSDTLHHAAEHHGDKNNSPENVNINEFYQLAVVLISTFADN